jgi:outer membrane protein OmpA-like peptidoglycan-associated protein
MPGATVYLHNLTTGKVDSMKLSENASYQFLVLPNMSYRISARSSGYLENGFNLSTNGLLSGDLLNDILLEETYIEKLTVFFEYDKWDLRSEFNASLTKMVRTLGKYKKATIYIGAHADAQGTREYNKRLSDKRAAAIVAFLKSRNIEEVRIQAFGFGEELILNMCSDGVECSDVEHSQNRRAEIKVQLEGVR